MDNRPQASLTPFNRTTHSGSPYPHLLGSRYMESSWSERWAKCGASNSCPKCPLPNYSVQQFTPGGGNLSATLLCGCLLSPRQFSINCEATQPVNVTEGAYPATLASGVGSAAPLSAADTKELGPLPRKSSAVKSVYRTSMECMGPILKWEVRRKGSGQHTWQTFVSNYSHNTTKALGPTRVFSFQDKQRMHGDICLVCWLRNSCTRFNRSNSERLDRHRSYSYN